MYKKEEYLSTYQPGTIIDTSTAKHGDPRSMQISATDNDPEFPWIVPEPSEYQKIG